MGFSVNTTHLLGDKAAKRKAFQRKKRGNEVLATSPQATSVCPAPVSPKAKHMDLLEAVSQREMDSQPFVSNSAGSLNPGSGYGLERSNAGGEEKSPGLGSDQSYREIAYNEYLTQKFGLDDAGPDRNIAALKNCVGSDALAVPQTEVSTVSMEMPFRFSMRDRRPKIQLTIPRTRSQHYVVIPQDGVKETISNQNHDTPKSVSPPSSISHSRTDSGGPLVRLSIISPLSEVQMPTPRRPFSTFSFEDMSLDMPSSTLLLSKSASSDSSDDTGENDDRSSNYSPRSSVSSLTSDPGATKPISVKRPSLAFSVISPTAAGVFDPMPHLSAFPKPPRGLKSSTSMTEWADRNKPLPPEPSPDIKPLNYSLHPFSRTNTMKTRRKTPTPLCVSRQSTIHIALQKTSLRSKYTPADLDALDDAFERTSPLNRQPTLYANPNSPTLSQAELELVAQLCIIGEEVPLEKEVVHLVHDPLQISRGPMHMEPSRKAPSPPQSQPSCDVSLGSRKKLKKKPSTHVVMQMRPGQEKDGLSRSPIAVPARSNSKAHRVLGRSRTGTPMEADTSAESCWDTSESPQSSSNISMGDSDTPASEVSPIIPDPTFEEVRQRLELLSPKDDASQVFLEFHERYLSGTPSTPSPIREQGSSQPQLDFSLSSMTSSENAEPSQLDQPLVTLNSVQSINNLSIEIIPTPTLDDAHLQNHGRVNEPSTRSLGSITASEIPEIYASLPSPKSTIRPASTELASTENLLTVEEAERMISADAAEKVLLRILENLDNLQDLFAAATVSRGFYRIFKRHELSLMKNALHSMSPAAWELREMAQSCPGFEDASKKSPKLGYTPTLYLQHYMRDMYTMIALKSMILVHCESFLRADTITALAGGETERASQIDDAFWRVWTFCRLFGCGTNREDDIVGQMDWLNGGVLAKQQRRNKNTVDMGTDVDINSITTDAPASFGQGNYGGLTAEDLYDMTEIWTCLGVLVRGFQGKRQLARDFGVFANSNITVGDVEKEDAELEEWTYHLLTLAPPAVLEVTSPNSPTAATFAHARSRGYTVWSPPSQGASRSTFLKEAVSRVYHEKMLQRHPTVQITTHLEANLETPSLPTEGLLSPRQRIAAHAAEIRAKRNDPAFKALLPSEERPMSNFPDVLSKLENSPVTEDCTSTLSSSSLTPSASLFPPFSGSSTPLTIQTPSRSSTLEKQFISSSTVTLSPQIRDPVDVAVDRLVKMGFEERKANKALAETDSGNSIDFDRALEMLVRERKRDVSSLMNWNYRGAIGDDEQEAKPGTSTIGLGIAGAERYA